MEDKRFNNAIEKCENLSSDTNKVKNEQSNKKWGYSAINSGNLNENAHNNGNSDAKRFVQKQRLEEERALERVRLANQKEEQKEQLKKEKALAKKQRIMHRKQQNREKRGEKKPNIGGWIATVVALSCACLVLTTILIYDNFMAFSGEKMLSNAYAKEFYDLVGYVDVIDVNLSKLTTSNDDENKQKILVDVITQASLAENDLASLPLHDSARYNTIKFVNQLADFSKYLNNKLIEGGKISKEDLATLTELKKINAKLKSELDTLAVDIGENFDFLTLLSGEESNPILAKFNELEYHALEYPKMIYDGPFADEPEQKDTNSNSDGQTAKEITQEQALELFNRYFSDYSLSEVRLEGIAEGKNFKAYNVVAKSGKYDLFAQISTSGKLVTCDSFRPSKNKNLTRDECITLATAFLQKCGYKSIKAVWTTEEDNTTYINFAGYNDGLGVVIYPDLIKVSVCMGSGVVCDVDAKLYIENNKERKIPTPKLRVEEAELKLSQDINIQASRLALIPMPSGKEKLAYEFFGENSEGEFYIYIDALSGKELQIFKVIKSKEGTLLL